MHGLTMDDGAPYRICPDVVNDFGSSRGRGLPATTLNEPKPRIFVMLEWLMPKYHLNGSLPDLKGNIYSVCSYSNALVV